MNAVLPIRRSVLFEKLILKNSRCKLCFWETKQRCESCGAFMCVNHVVEEKKFGEICLVCFRKTEKIELKGVYTIDLI